MNEIHSYINGFDKIFKTFEKFELYTLDKFELSVMYTGANKRDTGVTSPLDLSSPGGFAPRKRQRAETRRSGSVSPKPKPTPRPTTPPPVRCPSLCGHMPCGDGQAVNRWTIEDVVNYVSSIDICAEYAQVSGVHFLS